MISEKEINAVSKLDAFARYQYFIKRVADSEKMYFLLDQEGNFALAEVENQILLSLWSSPEFAKLCATGGWSEFTVREMTLDEFKESIIDQIETANWLLNIFSVGNQSGFVVDIDEFARDLSEELKKYQ